MVSIRSCVVALVVLLASTTVAFAQGTGDIVGRVTDTSGGVLPAVTVTATNVATRINRSTITSDTGDYTFTLLPIGSYTVKIELQGFQPIDARVSLATGDRARVDAKMQLGTGVIGAAVASGETACGDPSGSTDLHAPVVCIPLRVQDRPIGAVAIYRLLQQKTGFSPLDHELFTLLGGHAATSIFSARLYSQSERKRNTIQGFIDLLTK